MMSYFEEEHELDLVENLLEDLSIDPSKNDLYQLYGVFKKDMIDEPIYINDVRLAYNTKKSRHRLFKGKPEGFEHICTRESKHSGLRNFDPERSNKIHWIKPVIHYKENPRVKYFEREHSNGKNQQYYWLHEKDYVVVVREITSYLQLLTAFKVDKLNINKFKNWYKEYEK